MLSPSHCHHVSTILEALRSSKIYKRSFIMDNIPSIPPFLLYHGFSRAENSAKSYCLILFQGIHPIGHRPLLAQVGQLFPAPSHHDDKRNENTCRWAPPSTSECGSAAERPEAESIIEKSGHGK